MSPVGIAQKDATMLRKLKAREIYGYATAYGKIKSHQIIEALYTDFTSWEGLLDFAPVLRAPNGSTIILVSDPAMRIGVAQFQDTDVAIIAQQTPPSAQERGAYNYGLTQADGYGLALCMMDYAERYGLTLHTFIDTVGGDPFEASAAKLQSWLIAQCQTKMLSLNTRTIATIIGQGGSGGAIALQLAHRRYMLALSTYAVIAPEGAAAILFRQVNEETITAALDILQPTAEHMVKYGIVDAIIAEPALEAPDYVAQTVKNLDETLTRATQELAATDLGTLQQELHASIARCGRVAEPQPWYRRGRHLAKRLWSFPRPVVTTDPHIASIRRHIFGNPDCMPQACNPIKDTDGNILRHGCGDIFPAEAFRQNWHACPGCNRPDPLDPSTYVDLLLDADSFQELYAHLTLEDIDGWTNLYDYTTARQKSAKQSAGTEALVIGHGRMFGDLHLALALSNFAYLGGSMGAVVGEKFRAIVQFALEHRLPLLAITASGGARMQEGTVALAQMAKTTAAVLALRRAGLPYIAVLGHPTVGGVLASYATVADFIIAEEKATLSFAGDRVVKLTSQGRGLSPEVMSAEFFAQQGGIHAVVNRREMKSLIAGVLRMTPWYRELKQVENA
jgi:acetyl-CoA carboxylase carboxyl transferase beta subunit